ncbi:MAG: helix-turn-helix transcriptional regulator [Veillonellaceae bacterium]|nr:helix-turn-helix transcriptional regulator [Veillonellaceae bacterium]
MTFGENLKALRKARGLTQEEFAKQSGISRSAIGMYESGKREPKNFEMLETIADFFNVDMNTLLGTSKAPAPPAAQPPSAPLTAKDERDIMISASSLSPVLNEEEREHLRKYRSIDDAGRKIVDGTLDTVYRMRQDDTKPQ